MATASSSLICDPCKESGAEQVPVAICVECRELYCNFCLNCHRKMKLTKSHVYIFLNEDEAGEKCLCDLCNAKDETVTSLCVECRELYCPACTIRHRKFRASKHHVLIDIASEKLNFNQTYSGAQVPVSKKEQQNLHHGTYTKKEETRSEDQARSFVPDDNKTTQGSKPLHTDNTSKRSDVKQTSLSCTFHRTFSVRTPTDKNSNYIYRMISMPDGRICVADRGDFKIKLYTDDYALCDEVSLPVCSAITCVDDDTIAVATRRDILRYSVQGNRIKQTGRKLHIDGDIYDIAYRSGQFIIRYDKDNTDYTSCGSKLIVKQVRKLTLNNFLHYDPVGDCLLLGNFTERTITCYTLDGSVKWRIKSGGEPTGMVVVNGVVLVADFVNLTIRQITMEGNFLTTSLLPKDHGLARLYAITYQHKKQRLLVTKAQDDIVNVFNLSE